MMMTPAAAGDSRQPSRGRTCSDFSIHGPASCFQPMLVHAFEESHSLPRNELETEVERFQSKVKKAVAKDIRSVHMDNVIATHHQFRHRMSSNARFGICSDHLFMKQRVHQPFHSQPCHHLVLYSCTYDHLGMYR